MITSIGNVAIWVSDLERSERFYVEGLGLDVIARIEAPEVRELIVGRGGSGTQLMLAAVMTPSIGTTLRTHPEFLPSGGAPRVGLWKSFVWSDALQRDVAAATRAGGTLVQGATFLEQFGLTIAVLADPDGNFVEVGHRGNATG